ncbi:hypothetical protein [Sinorhizobium meliloti]|uniref:hypothetical protein n=1 Tax=Rhizobium meliloti TaxID=382 RepID=UPI000408BC99|nr:hypothetical protein [Sinorhizobium meliloti]UFX13112.1 hypothetical protein SmelRRI128_34785 [Sinorhizobium meliloti]
MSAFSLISTAPALVSTSLGLGAALLHPYKRRKALLQAAELGAAVRRAEPAPGLPRG